MAFLPPKQMLAVRLLHNTLSGFMGYGSAHVQNPQKTEL